MSHTPGDWQWGTSSWTHVRTVDAPSERFPGSREEIAQVMGATPERAEANARLFVAAPKLLATFKALAAACEADNREFIIPAMIAAARDVIALAEGREP